MTHSDVLETKTNRHTLMCCPYIFIVPTLARNVFTEVTPGDGPKNSRIRVMVDFATFRKTVMFFIITGDVMIYNQGVSRVLSLDSYYPIL